MLQFRLQSPCSRGCDARRADRSAARSAGGGCPFEHISCHEGAPMKLLSVLCAATIAALPLAACHSTPTPKSAEKRADVKADAQAALNKAQADDPTLSARLNECQAYAVFPKVGKGAAGVGGAYGHGVLYEQGKMVGYCDL